MDINTRKDEKVLNKENIIHFPEGLIGFESLKDYNVLSSETEKDLHWLQPAEAPDIEFAVTFPQIFQINYELTLTDDEEKLLKIEDGDELIVLVTLSKKTKARENETLLNANFIAPIIINFNKQLGFQKILTQEKNPITITMKG
ncbi:MAG: flagellar assembly protein FliW [Gammaproteobacteria bacterium]|nr:flagellar assembly protein FliW [Gammaproteobacteria bacterium]